MTLNVVKMIFVLSPGYATLPEPLQFVYMMVTNLAEGRFSVVTPAPNRLVDSNNYYPPHSELPAIWADISNAIQYSRIAAQLGWCWMKSWGWSCPTSPGY